MAGLKNVYPIAIDASMLQISHYTSVPFALSVIIQERRDSQSKALLQ